MQLRALRLDGLVTYCLWRVPSLPPPAGRDGSIAGARLEHVDETQGLHNAPSACLSVVAAVRSAFVPGTARLDEQAAIDSGFLAKGQRWTGSYCRKFGGHNFEA